MILCDYGIFSLDYGGINYPDLKTDKLYHNLVVQLEGRENRITVAKKRYIDAIQAYNSH